MNLRIGCVIVGFLSLVLSMSAQTTGGSSTASPTVPLLMNFSGVLADLNGKPLTGVVGVTFSLYKEQQDASPIWQETQNVQAGKTGHYTIALGSGSSQGLPADFFATGEARWLGVRPQEQEEQPRVMLLSVPYALKALDAENLGGRPASDFLAATGAAQTPAGGVTGSGTKNFIPRWTSASQIGNSNIFENSSNQVGIATSTPAATLDVKGTADIRDTLTLFPNGSAAALKLSGSAFAISKAGAVTFTAGQTFSRHRYDHRRESRFGSYGRRKQWQRYACLDQHLFQRPDFAMEWHEVGVQQRRCGRYHWSHRPGSHHWRRYQWQCQDRFDQFLFQRAGAPVERRCVGVLLGWRRDYHRGYSWN